MLLSSWNQKWSYVCIYTIFVAQVQENFGVEDLKLTREQAKIQEILERSDTTYMCRNICAENNTERRIICAARP